MIIVDYSGSFISILYASRLMDMFETKNKEPVDLNLIRHAVLNTLRTYKKTFGRKSGKDLIIAAEGGRTWRKNYFQFYKENRKKNRDESSTDWNKVFESMNQILDEIDQFSPFIVMKVQGAEADDVIGVLSQEYSKNYSETFSQDQQVYSFFDEQAEGTHSDISLIISEDKDFHQLQRFNGVQQFYPRKKKFYTDHNPLLSLSSKIIFGDAGDGVPNILSDDDTFVTPNKRQKVLTEKRFQLIQPWAEQQIKIENSLMDPDIQFSSSEFDITPGWCRNRMMIDLQFIPEQLKSQILSEFSQKRNKSESPALFMEYLFKNKCKHLISDINDFFNPRGT
jgi:hypothetical protein